MKVNRTPDERFEGLVEFPFEPHYQTISDGEGGGLRIHLQQEAPHQCVQAILDITQRQ